MSALPNGSPEPTSDDFEALCCDCGEFFPSSELSDEDETACRYCMPCHAERCITDGTHMIGCHPDGSCKVCGESPE